MASAVLPTKEVFRGKGSGGVEAEGVSAVSHWAPRTLALPGGFGGYSLATGPQLSYPK